MGYIRRDFDINTLQMNMGSQMRRHTLSVLRFQVELDMCMQAELHVWELGTLRCHRVSTHVQWDPKVVDLALWLLSRLSCLDVSTLNI